MISKIIRPGDKIDIRLVQHVENADKNGKETAIYKSQVLDILEDESLEIAMPTASGKQVLLQSGIRFELIFYCGSSLYRSVGVVTGRYKHKNFYVLMVKLKKPLERFQRRAFFRYSCILNAGYFVLNEKQKKMKSADEILKDLMDDEFKEKQQSGIIVDISGGGMKLRSLKPLKANSPILLLFRLTNQKVDRQFCIRGQIIACQKMEKTEEPLFESRIKFIIEDNRIREEIIQYIFEEERKIRQKENG